MDPGEQENLAAQFPEQVAALKAKMAAFEAAIAPLPAMQK